MAPYVRPFFKIAQTTLRDPDGYRYPFLGAFTSKDLAAGTLLGFYNGSFRQQGSRGYTGRNPNVFSTSDFHIIPKYSGAPNENSSDDDEPLDARHARKMRALATNAASCYPLATVNEPPPGHVANVMAVEIRTAKDFILDLPPRTTISALAYYTTRPVVTNEELFVHYGPGYSRRHYENPDDRNPRDLVGKASYIKKQHRETVRDAVQQHGPSFAHVPKECYTIY